MGRLLYYIVLLCRGVARIGLGCLPFRRTRLLEVGLDSTRAELTLLLSNLHGFSDRQHSVLRRRLVSGNSFLGVKDLAVMGLDGGMWLLWLSLAWEHHLATEIELTADFVPARIRVQELLVVINIDFLDSRFLYL